MPGLFSSEGTVGTQSGDQPREIAVVDDVDRDSLNTISLSMIPFETPGLRRALMLKNARYQGVVELFKGEGSGSGQVEVDQIANVFNDITEGDLNILRKLADLPSYDIYSLRIMLREQKIPVSDFHDLKLSGNKTRELDEYMRSFTRPLLLEVYGKEGDMHDFDDVIALFRQPDVSLAREKLGVLAERLEVNLWQFPALLHDYGDAYLSVSYYRQCYDQVAPHVRNVRDSLDELVKHPQMRQDRELVQTCNRISTTVDLATEMMRKRFEVFERSTRQAWRDINGDRFRALRERILSNQAMLGGMLCGLTVCLESWAEKFPNAEVGGVHRRAEYVRSELRFGIEPIRAIRAPSSEANNKSPVVAS